MALAGFNDMQIYCLLLGFFLSLEQPQLLLLPELLTGKEAIGTDLITAFPTLLSRSSKLLTAFIFSSGLLTAFMHQ